MGFAAKFELKAGYNIVVILGQVGNDPICGTGGTFVIFQRGKKSELLMAAGGAASCSASMGRQKGLMFWTFSQIERILAFFTRMPNFEA